MKQLVLLLAMVIPLLAFAQEGTKDALRFGDTNMTNKKPKYKSKGQGDKSRRILTIVKNNPKNTLAGNKCFEDFLTDLGIRYLVQTESNPQYTPLKRYFHNVGVRIRTTIRNGPFWRIKLIKKRKECRLLLHDFVGYNMQYKPSESSAGDSDGLFASSSAGDSDGLFLSLSYAGDSDGLFLSLSSAGDSDGL